MKSSSRFFKVLIGSIISVTAVAGITIISLPYVASSPWGRNQILTIVNSSIPGRVEASKISLTWFGEQKIENLKLKTPDGETVLSFENFTTNTPLHTIIGGNLSGITNIKDLNLLIEKNNRNNNGFKNSLNDGVNGGLNNSVNGGLNNSVYTTVKTNANPGNKFEAALGFNVIPANIGLSAKNVNVTMTTEGANWAVKAEGITQEIDAAQRETLSGRFDADIKFSDGQLSGTADVINFPVRLLELMNNVPPNTYTNVLGETINLKMDESFKDQTLALKLNIKTSTTNLDFKVNIEPSVDNHLFIKSTGQLNDQNFTLNAKIQAPKGSSDTAENNLNIGDEFFTNLSQPREIVLRLDRISTDKVDYFLGTNIKSMIGSKASLIMSANATDPRAVTLQIDADNLSAENIVIKIDQDLSGVTLPKNLSGKVTVDTLTFKGPTISPSIREVLIPWKARNNFQEIDLTLTGLAVNGSFDGNLSFIAPSQSLSFAFNGKKIPAELFHLITGYDEFTAILGPVVEGVVKAEINQGTGQLQANLKGTNGYVDLNAEVKDNKILLKDSLIVESQVTPELTSKVLTKFAPVFAELIKGDSPIRLTVSPENFAFPIKKFDLKEVQVGKATLELGKLVFRNSGEVKSLMGVLHSPRSEQISVWTTPLHVSFNRGILDISRMDMLFMDKYPIATWGTINFEKNDMNVIVGLRVQTLESALKIQGLAKDYMLQLPIRGKIESAKIDKTKAGTEIASLIAKQTGRPEGMVVGTLLQIANGKKQKVPAQTTNPLPWEE